jgi:hypothetical protein
LIELKVNLEGKRKTTTALAVVDSGATGNLVSKKLVKRHHIPELELPQKMDLINANGTKSTIDTRIKVNMTIGRQGHNHKKQISFFVRDIGTHDILLGTDRLIKHNPTIDWNRYTLTMNRCPHTCKQQYPITVRAPKQQTKGLANRHIEIKTPMTTEEELENHWNNLKSIMVARMIFHDKMPPQATEDLGNIQQAYKEQLM